jgi:ABC-type sulfate/molybdate transport systems ATPase subunit
MREEHLVTSIVITPDRVSAYDVADKVALLAHGKILAQGDPETMFELHNEDVLPFAISSGIDLKRLGPRKERRSPEEIRARWGAHPQTDEGHHGHRFFTWRHAGRSHY